MHEHGGTAGILSEGKQFTFEGGQRVPTLAMWPDVIKAGSVYDDLALMMDWFPTFAEIQVRWFQMTGIMTGKAS